MLPSLPFGEINNGIHASHIHAGLTMLNSMISEFNNIMTLRMDYFFFEGVGFGQFSGTFEGFVFIFRLCVIFWVDISLSKDFLTSKNRTYIEESTCSIFFPKAALG